MKKFLSILLIAVMAVSVLAGCGKKEEGGNAAAGEQEYKLGMGVVVSTDSSKETNAQVDATVVAVVTDADNKIVDCFVDVAQNKMAVEGGVATVGQTYKTKQEKKEEYGMKGVSGIGKEWYEQANAFADFVTGKTVAEATGLQMEESNGHMVSTDADLLAGCTMDISDMVEALTKACNDPMAKTFKSASAPKVAVSALTEDGGSKDATAEENGVASMDTTFGAAVVVDGKVAAAILDVIQPKVNFDANGVVDAAFKATKRELKEEYGMKGVSGIGKEWYEQAEAFTNYLAGKTVDEVAGIKTVESNGHNVAEDADILAGCTMDISAFLTVLNNVCK